MSKTFRSGRSVHALVQDGPVEAVLALFRQVDPGLDFDRVAGLAGPAARAALFEALGASTAVPARRLDDLSRRILGLATGRGTETLSRVLRAGIDHAAFVDVHARMDPIGRSLWAYTTHKALFENAESVQHAAHFRDCGRIYAAFDVPAGVDFAWTPEMAETLRVRMVAALGLEGAVGLTHLLIPEDGDEPESHVVIVRHGGAASSVAEHRRDGARDHHYYVPSNEVTLIYAPKRGVVEVCAASTSARQDAASVFAETGLGQDLSRKPLSFKLYDLSRFRTSLALQPVEPAGFDVISCAVIEADTRPHDPRRRLSLKVPPDDDIEQALAELAGLAKVFRSCPITRVVISVQYRDKEKRRPHTLNLTLSHPNRCNLRDQADPELRRLGYELLEAWGVLQSLRTMTLADEASLLPALLQLYDLGREEMTEHELTDRGFDLGALKRHGFVEPAGRLQSMILDEDDGGPELVELADGMHGLLQYEDPTGGQVWQPRAMFAKYRLNHDWIEEVVRRCLAPALAPRTFLRIDRALSLLGEAELDGQRVPVYLARSLGDVRTLRRIDAALRARSGSGVGIVLDSGGEGPRTLGANVVVDLAPIVRNDAGAPKIDVDALRVVYVHGKARARDGVKVELCENRQGGVGVLYLPAKEPLLVTGEDQLRIMRRLVDAHDRGYRVVRTKELMETTGSASPSQAFPNWKGCVDRYIQSPSRGFWQLAV